MTAPKQAVPSKCLQCHAKLNTPVVCEECYSLYPVPSTVDYFGLFQLPRGYEVNPAELEKRFLSMSRNIHPDFFTTQPAEVRQLAVRLAAEINEAHRVLKDPVLRAEYLLELAGGESAAQDKSVPGEFLNEVMLLREAVETALARDDQRAVAEHRATLMHRREETLDKVAAIADRLSDAKYAERLELRRMLNSIKYYDNILKLL